MKKMKKVILIPRCVFTPGFKSALQKSPEELEEITKVLIDSATRIIQLPCPHLESLTVADRTECTVISPKDFSNKYNGEYYLILYRKILKPVISTINHYQERGIQLTSIIGVKGSPSCSVSNIADNKNLNHGQFMRTLIKKLKEKSTEINMADI
ncbi:MAG: hypothetical protein JEZ14_04605 [Marinilabiliaceae bacterium]|nr:hypothetical protein [Marinilabiliaceae bacterium]